jgi:hypothetical protein
LVNTACKFLSSQNKKGIVLLVLLRYNYANIVLMFILCPVTL